MSSCTGTSAFRRHRRPADPLPRRRAIRTEATTATASYASPTPRLPTPAATSHPTSCIATGREAAKRNFTQVRMRLHHPSVCPFVCSFISTSSTQMASAAGGAGEAPEKLSLTATRPSTMPASTWRPVTRATMKTMTTTSTGRSRTTGATFQVCQSTSVYWVSRLHRISVIGRFFFFLPFQTSSHNHSTSPTTSTTTPTTRRYPRRTPSHVSICFASTIVEIGF